MIEYISDMWNLAVDGGKQGVLFFAALYTFLVCLYSFIRQILIIRWSVTKGVLKNASLSKQGAQRLVLSDQEYKLDSLYSYKVGDIHYQGTRVSPWIIIASHNAKFLLEKQLSGITNNEDGTVNVLYNPNNPHKSYLIQPGVIGMAVTLAIAILPVVLYLIEYL